MKIKSIFAILILTLVIGRADTSPLFQNFGYINTTPVVDATAFVNGGTIDLSFTEFSMSRTLFWLGNILDPPFDTQNTLYFTNLATGTMISDTGFIFDFVTNAFRYPANSFFNQGLIQGYIVKINATNVVHNGMIYCGSEGYNYAEGLAEVNGKNVDLTGGAIATGLSSGASYLGVPIYVGAGTNNSMSTNAFNIYLDNFSFPLPVTPRHEVNDLQNQGNRFLRSVYLPSSFTNGNYGAIAYTNIIGPTNRIIQIIYAPTNFLDNAGTFRMGFIPDRISRGATAVAIWELPDFDIINMENYTNFIYFIDTQGIQDGLRFMTNMNGQVIDVFNYNLLQSKRPLLAYEFSPTNSIPYSDDLIMGTNYETQIISNNLYTAYSYYVGSYTVPSDYQSNYGGEISSYLGLITGLDLNPALTDPTNNPGRISVKAENLDLSRTRFVSSSMVTIETDNLINSSELICNSPILVMDLNSKSGTISIETNTVQMSVKRLLGKISAWTGVWTNNLLEVQPDGSTNYVNVKFVVLFLDHQLVGEQPVNVYSLILRSTNSIINANVNVTRSFLCTSQGLLINTNGILTCSDMIKSFTSTNFPNLLYLTNNGEIYNNATFEVGYYREKPLQTFINNSNIVCSEFYTRSKISAFPGILFVEGGAKIVSDILKLDNGLLSAGSQVDIQAQELKGRNSTIVCGKLSLTVTNRLSDGGPGANNYWFVSDGIEVYKLPAQSDLTGTTIEASATKFAMPTILWPGKNMGASPLGYSNNLSVGSLTLNGELYSRFIFKPEGTNNAIYVDYLEFMGYTYTNIMSAISSSKPVDAISISPGMVVYFAAANISEEKLDGLCNGQLRWVRSYAGANSSTNVVLSNGQVIQVNKALRTSTTIDSDGDGIVNGLDADPFSGVRVRNIIITNAPEKGVAISWNATPQVTYYVEYSTNLIAGPWNLLGTTVNPASTNKIISIVDPLPTQPNLIRFYRVRYDVP